MHRYILSLFFFVASFNTWAEPLVLRFTIDVIRHGDRTPIQDIPLAPYNWSQGPGQLTPKGMQQEYELGVAMRKRIIQDKALLPQTFDVQTLYVRSTDIDRTLMSAQSLLSGLYPLGTGPKNALPQAQQVIPIHTVPKAQDALLLGDDATTHRKLLEQYVFSRPDWQAKTKALAPYFSHWQALTGVTLTELYQLTPLADALYIRGLYHIPLPKGMTKEEANTIIAAGNWAFITAYTPPEIGQAAGGKLLSTIAKKLEEAAHPKTPLKAILYSAHDSTILSLMSAMHAPLKEKPPYASHLNFSLLQKGNAWYVAIRFNDEPVSIPACQKVLCRLSEFPVIARGDAPKQSRSRK